MALYQSDYTAIGEVLDYSLEELYIYGSSRLGMYKPQGDEKKIVNPANPSMQARPAPHTGTYQFLNRRQYELCNHLGNVISTVKDDLTGGVMESSGEYYAFGSPMAGRSFGVGGYRFGYGGHEKNDEVSGSGNSVVDSKCKKRHGEEKRPL